MQITGDQLTAEQPLTVVFGKTNLKVNSFAAASKAYRDMIEKKDMGASRAPQCHVWEGCKLVATVSFNGKVQQVNN